MSESDKRLEQRLRIAQSAREAGRVPDFRTTWYAAERRVGRRRRRRLVIAGSVAVLALALLIRPGDDLYYIDTNELLDTTSWSAPSDSLMPERQFDIFGEMPVLIESTETYGGALL